MFDLSLTKIAVLLVLAIVIFGPDQLPKVAAQAGRTLRELRRLAEQFERTAAAMDFAAARQHIPMIARGRG